MPLADCSNDECDKRTRYNEDRGGLCHHCWSKTEAGRAERKTTSRSPRVNNGAVLTKISENTEEILRLLTEKSASPVFHADAMSSTSTEKSALPVFQTVDEDE